METPGCWHLLIGARVRRGGVDGCWMFLARLETMATQIAAPRVRLERPANRQREGGGGLHLPAIIAPSSGPFSTIDNWQLDRYRYLNRLEWSLLQMVQLFHHSTRFRFSDFFQLFQTNFTTFKRPISSGLNSPLRQRRRQPNSNVFQFLPNTNTLVLFQIHWIWTTLEIRTKFD